MTMENRRLFIFLLSTMTFLWIWSSYLAPKPPEPEVATEDVAQEQASAEAGELKAGELSASGLQPGETPKAQGTEAASVQSAAATPEVPAVQIPEYERTSVTLGSLQAESGYALEVILTSAGAAVESVSLTSPQFHDLQDVSKAARIIGNNLTEDRTLSTSVSEVDRLLLAQGQSLETVNWKLAKSETTEKAATAVWEYDSPDGQLRLRKTYTLPRSKLTAAELASAWREDPSLYTVTLTLDVINLTAQQQQVDYELQGPVGLLLENKEHTFKYHDIHIEFADSKAVSLNIAALQGYCDRIDEELGYRASLSEQRDRLKEDREWMTVPRYAGVDVQFFSAMVAPLSDAAPEADKLTAVTWIDRTYPMLIAPDIRERTEPFFVARIMKGLWTAFAGREVDPRTADLSFRIASAPLTIQANGTVSHKYAFFVGPKRRELLDPEPFAAGQVLNYGWFGPVARVMHFLLDFFHRLGLPYVLAIACLTILVRGCLFPLSKKQAIMAARQKELQPQLKALKEKYADDQQQFARAQMELWRKNNINPLSGCLPLFLQLPIFVGLYTALNSAVDLRGQSFLWIDNLAAPDALFRLPFALPFGMGHDFSILPLCTVALFLTQQKMFMPPAQDEQQEMQYKMMNMMTGVMGIFFWHQPAGLCVYFIASSIWSIAERKLLGTAKPAAPGGAAELLIPEESARFSGNAKNAARKPEAPAKPGFFQKLLDAAADAQKQAESQRLRDGRKGKKKQD